VGNAAKIKAAFAPGTDTNDPGAAPAIWTDAAAFNAAADKFAADAANIGAATDGPSLQATVMALQGDCGGCHRTYRRHAAAPRRASRAVSRFFRKCSSRRPLAACCAAPILHRTI